jgi:hypothetical protein
MGSAGTGSCIRTHHQNYRPRLGFLPFIAFREISQGSQKSCLSWCLLGLAVYAILSYRGRAVSLGAYRSSANYAQRFRQLACVNL